VARTHKASAVGLRQTTKSTVQRSAARRISIIIIIMAAETPTGKDEPPGAAVELRDASCAHGGAQLPAEFAVQRAPGMDAPGEQSAHALELYRRIQANAVELARRLTAGRPRVQLGAVAPAALDETHAATSGEAATGPRALHHAETRHDDGVPGAEPATEPLAGGTALVSRARGSAP
jgi:hypothetical protein